MAIPSYAGSIDTAGGTAPFSPAGGMLDYLRKQGGWPGPAAARDTDIEEEVISERARSGPQGIQLPWFLPYFDNQQSLGETQAMRLAYRTMLASPEVKAAFLGKVLAVAALDLKVIPASRKDPADARVAEFVRWNLTESLEGGVPGLIWSVLSGALIDGYSICEKVWCYEDQGEYAGKYVLRAIKPKDTGHDLVLVTDQYRNITSLRGLRYNPGMEFDPAGFLIYRHLPLWDNPTGMSDFRGVYRDFWMLDTVMKLWAQGLDKYSLPVLIGHFTNPQQQPSLAAALGQIKSRNWLTVPHDVQVQVLELAGGSLAAYDAAVQRLSHKIALGIQGAILQSLEGSVADGRGNSMVHRATADLLVWYLSQSVEALLNDRRKGLLRDIVDLNDAVMTYPRVSLSSVDPSEMAGEMEVTRALWEVGMAQSKQEIYDLCNRTPPDPDDFLDSLGGKPAQDVQVASATLMTPHGPGAAGARDGIISDHVHQQGVTGEVGPGGATLPGLGPPVPEAGQMVDDGVREMDEHRGTPDPDTPTSTGLVVGKDGHRYFFVAGKHMKRHGEGGQPTQHHEAHRKRHHADWLDPAHAHVHDDMAEQAARQGIDPFVLRHEALQHAHAATAPDPVNRLRQAYRSALASLPRRREFGEGGPHA